MTPRIPGPRPDASRILARTPAPGHRGVASPGCASPKGIWRADIEHLAQVIEVIARDLTASPLGCWLVPDTAVRLPVLRRVAQILLPHALRHGQIHVADHGLGVAVWYQRPARGLPAIPALTARLTQATGRYHGRITAMLDARQRLLPRGRAYDHLAVLAVRPDSRGRRVASRLLDHHHRLLDLLERDAYADVVDHRMQHLLTCHGYRPGLPAPAGPSCFELWPLHRSPHAPSTFPEGRQ